MRVKDAVGRFGEQAAVEFLEGSGWRILERNWRCPLGEIDIVARDRDALVIVEVKTRSSTAFGDPAEAVRPAKAARLHRLAAQWLAERRASVMPSFWPEVRFDVITVLLSGVGEPVIGHVRSAF